MHYKKRIMDYEMQPQEHFRSDSHTQIQTTCVIRDLYPQKASNRLVPVECSLDVTGADFKHLIAAKFEIPHNLIKLICKGRVVQDGKSLNEQGVKVQVTNSHSGYQLCCSLLFLLWLLYFLQKSRFWLKLQVRPAT